MHASNVALFMDDLTPLKTRRGGFTLIELLVVVLIISLLVAIALPALSSVRRGATSAACLSNVRQIGLASESFLAGHQEQFPKARYMPLPFLTTLDTDAFPAAPIAMDDYIDRGVPVWRCPGDTGEVQVHRLTADAGEASASYTYNASLGERTMKESWLVERLGLNPSQVWVFKDFDGGSDVALMDGSKVSIPFFHLHRNFVFADGHASSDLDL